MKKFLTLLSAVSASALGSASAFTVITGSVSEIAGPDDLFLDPATNLIAVNSAGVGDVVVNGVNFQGDGTDVTTGTVSNGAYTIVTSRDALGGGAIGNWATPAGGGVTPIYGGADPTSAGNLGIVMQSIRWAQGAEGAPPAPNGLGLDINVSGLTSGSLYDIQLLFNEGRATPTDPLGGRRWDIGVEGIMVVDDFSSRGGDGTWSDSNGFVYRGQFDPGADGILTVRFAADLGGDPFSGTDGNPILDGIIVHQVIPEPSTGLLIGIAAGALALRRRRR